MIETLTCSAMRLTMVCVGIVITSDVMKWYGKETQSWCVPEQRGNINFRDAIRQNENRKDI